jgi:hypothetical protein
MQQADSQQGRVRGWEVFYNSLKKQPITMNIFFFCGVGTLRAVHKGKGRQAGKQHRLIVKDLAHAKGAY